MNILEALVLILSFIGLVCCLINSIMITIDLKRTIKRNKILDEEIQKELKKLAEDTKNLTENIK